MIRIQVYNCNAYNACDWTCSVEYTSLEREVAWAKRHARLVGYHATVTVSDSTTGASVTFDV